MYALPDSTLLSKQIPKKAIFEKFSLSSAQRQRIDADIARIDIVAHLSPDTLPAIAKSAEIKGIYVMAVSLKTKSHSKESISLLARLIPQHMLFALCHEGEVQLAIVHEGLHTSSWLAQNEVQIPIVGLNFDSVWAHIVAYVGDIALNHEQTLEEQIQSKQEQERLLKEVERLETKINKERALGKQIQLRNQINRLRKLLEIRNNEIKK